MLTAFGDESYDTKKQRVFTIGALVGEQSKWDALEVKWLARMPQGVNFHAAECQSDVGDFAQFTHEENTRLYIDAVKMIVESGLFGYAFSSDLAAEQEAFQGGMLEGGDSRYYWLMSKVIASCARFAYLCVPQEKVKFTFDGRLESNFNAAQFYDYMVGLKEWRHHPFIDDEIGFATRKTVGVQVADLVAREAMKHLDNMIGPVKRPMRKSMDVLVKTNRFKFTYYTGDFFKGLVKSVAALDDDPKFPIKRAEYAAWLGQNGVLDSTHNRLRYFAYVDAQARLSGTADEPWEVTQ